MSKAALVVVYRGLSGFGCSIWRGRARAYLASLSAASFSGILLCAFTLIRIDWMVNLLINSTIQWIVRKLVSFSLRLMLTSYVLRNALIESVGSPCGSGHGLQC